jgi:hypothetical protein
VTAIARLAWMRLWRGRTIWLSAILFAAPVLLAGLTAARMRDAEERWRNVAELALRSMVLLAPVVHLATALSEELESRTFTYLWSRPISRPAILLGKMLAIVPALIGMGLVSMGATWALCGAGHGLGSALLATAVGIAGASAFAVGIGTLFPRHPLVVALGYVFFAEQILPEIPSVQRLTTLFHVTQIAGVGEHAGTEGTLEALVTLAILSTIWIALALWKIRGSEYAKAES